jgi:hypothetical protein
VLYLLQAFVGHDLKKAWIRGVSLFRVGKVILYFCSFDVSILKVLTKTTSLLLLLLLLLLSCCGFSFYHFHLLPLPLLPPHRNRIAVSCPP